MDDWLVVLTLASALGAGLVAGVFFAFSTFVMKALGRLPPAQGIAAMQSINVVVLTPPFMIVLFGTAVACAVLAIHASSHWREPGAVYLFVGSLVYVVGTVVVTIVFNVPRNNALAVADASRPESAALWARYLTTWTAWNHVRTASALAASALLVIFLLSSRTG